MLTFEVCLDTQTYSLIQCGTPPDPRFPVPPHTTLVPQERWTGAAESLKRAEGRLKRPHVCSKAMNFFVHTMTPLHVHENTPHVTLRGLGAHGARVDTPAT